VHRALLTGVISLVLVACGGGTQADATPGDATPGDASVSAEATGTTSASSAATPTGQSIAAPCPAALFSWGQTVPRAKSADGSYSVELQPCETLWFSSESAVLDGTPVCTPASGQNCVLLYTATEPASLVISVAADADLGHEWWGVTRAGSASIISAWAANALKAPSCTDGCASLQIQLYVDGQLVATETYPR
jgi:hypothetical protein